MIYKAILSDDKTLEHHGISGQKWGVKHGPPYPLSRQSASGRKTVKSTNKSKLASSKSNNVGTNNKKSFLRPLTDEEKQRLLLTVGLCAVSAVILYNPVQTSSLVGALVNSTAQMLGPETMAEACKNINKACNAGGGNCPGNAVGMLLRTYGQNVTVSTSNLFHGDTSEHVLENIELLTNGKATVIEGLTESTTNIWKGVSLTTSKAIESLGDFEKRLLTMVKDGDKGTISGDGGLIGSHIWNWACENGKIVYYDGQVKNSALTAAEVGRRYSVFRIINATNWGNVTATDINTDAIKNIVSNVDNSSANYFTDTNISNELKTMLNQDISKIKSNIEEYTDLIKDIFK